MWAIMHGEAGGAGGGEGAQLALQSWQEHGSVSLEGAF